MLAAISASRALRNNACRLDPGFRRLAVSLSRIASRANRSSNGCSCSRCRRSDIGPSVVPCFQNSHLAGVVPNSKGTNAKVVRGPLAVQRDGKGVVAATSTHSTAAIQITDGCLFFPNSSCTSFCRLSDIGISFHGIPRRRIHCAPVGQP